MDVVETGGSHRLLYVLDGQGGAISDPWIGPRRRAYPPGLKSGGKWIDRARGASYRFSSENVDHPLDILQVERKGPISGAPVNGWHCTRAYILP